MSQASQCSEDATAIPIEEGSEKALVPFLGKKGPCNAVLPNLDAKGQPEVDRD